MLSHVRTEVGMILVAEEGMKVHVSVAMDSRKANVGGKSTSEYKQVCDRLIIRDGLVMMEIGELTRVTPLRIIAWLDYKLVKDDGSTDPE